MVGDGLYLDLRSADRDLRLGDRDALRLRDLDPAIVRWGRFFRVLFVASPQVRLWREVLLIKHSFCDHLHIEIVAQIEKFNGTSGDLQTRQRRGLYRVASVHRKRHIAACAAGRHHCGGGGCGSDDGRIAACGGSDDGRGDNDGRSARTAQLTSETRRE
jgi:hypothetical protein